MVGMEYSFASSLFQFPYLSETFQFSSECLVLTPTKRGPLLTENNEVHKSLPFLNGGKPLNLPQGGPVFRLGRDSLFRLLFGTLYLPTTWDLSVPNPSFIQLIIDEQVTRDLSSGESGLYPWTLSKTFVFSVDRQSRPILGVQCICSDSFYRVRERG